MKLFCAVIGEGGDTLLVIPPAMSNGFELDELRTRMNNVLRNSSSPDYPEWKAQGQVVELRNVKVFLRLSSTGETHIAKRFSTSLCLQRSDRWMLIFGAVGLEQFVGDDEVCPECLAKWKELNG